MNKVLEALKNYKETKVVLGPWTLVELIAESGQKGYGASHKSKLDKMNEELGYQIALGRAKKDLICKVNGSKSKRRNFLVG